LGGDLDFFLRLHLACHNNECRERADAQSIR
jgi:hypothetical protein